MKKRDLLLMLDYYFDHDFEKVVNEINNKEHPEIFSDKYFIKGFKKEMSSLKKRGVKTLTILDDDYPDAFNKIVKPPLVIFYTGDINVLKDAVENKTYSYLTGPNKFGFDENTLITNKFNIITFGNNKLNLWTDMSPSISRIIPAVSNMILCTRKLKKDDNFILIVASSCINDCMQDLYIVPTLEPSVNNELINDGAYLLDQKIETIKIPNR